MQNLCHQVWRHHKNGWNQQISCSKKWLYEMMFTLWQHSPPSSVMTTTMVSGPAPSGLKTRRETRYCVNTDSSSRVWLWWKSEDLRIWLRWKLNIPSYSFVFGQISGIAGYLSSRVFNADFLGILGACVPRPDRERWQSKIISFQEWFYIMVC